MKCVKHELQKFWLQGDTVLLLREKRLVKFSCLKCSTATNVWLVLFWYMLSLIKKTLFYFSFLLLVPQMHQSNRPLWKSMALPAHKAIKDSTALTVKVTGRIHLGTKTLLLTLEVFFLKLQVQSIIQYMYIKRLFLFVHPWRYQRVLDAGRLSERRLSQHTGQLQMFLQGRFHAGKKSMCWWVRDLSESSPFSAFHCHLNNITISPK